MTACQLQCLLADSARRHPDAVAVHDLGQRMTYRELDRLADRFAAALRAFGVRPRDRVVIWSHKSAQAVAVMQAALRVGAIYVPVTGSNPSARLSLIARDAKPALVVTDNDTLGRARAARWDVA